MKRIPFLLKAVLSSSIFCAAAGTMSASVIFHDPFLTVSTSPNPNAGQYRVNNTLNSSPNNAVNGGPIIGFSGSNVWSGASSLPRPVEAGLTSTSVQTSGGAVQFRGSADTTNRMNYRAIDSYESAPQTYFSGIMQTNLIDDDATSLIAFTSLGGDTRGTSILDNTGGFYNGVAFGFLGNGSGGMDLIVRYRTDTLAYVDFTLLSGISVNTPYTVMGRIDWNVNPENRDTLTIWVNPQSATEPAGGVTLPSFLGDPTTINSVYLLQKSFGTGLDDAVYMDELRLGTSWADLQPIPEPSSVALIMGALGLSVLMFRRSSKS